MCMYMAIYIYIYIIYIIYNISIPVAISSQTCVQCIHISVCHLLNTVPMHLPPSGKEPDGGGLHEEAGDHDGMPYHDSI